MGKKSKRPARSVGAELPKPPPIDPVRREELRQRLRQKIQGREAPTHEVAKQLLDDPASALMRMGVDDPSILRAAPGMVRSIAERVRSGKPVQGERALQDTLVDVCNALDATATADSSDEEEAPPMD